MLKDWDLKLDTAAYYLKRELKRALKAKVAGKISCGVTGGLLGTMVGIAAVPAVMAIESIAPVSYPIIGFGQGICFPTESIGKKLAFGAAGAALGVVAIPMAPLDMVTAPVRVPLTSGAAGAVIGTALGHFAIDKR